MELKCLKKIKNKLFFQRKGILITNKHYAYRVDYLLSKRNFTKNSIRPKDVIGLRLLKKVNVGITNTNKKMSELRIESKKPLIRDFYSAKMYLKDKSGNRRKAKKVFIKPVFGYTLAEQKTSARREAKILNKMRLTGLPVPKAGVIEHNGQYVLVIESFLKDGGANSKLIPINNRSNRPDPEFLRQLNAQEHAGLIKDLGRDVSQIINLGLSTEYFDIHGFYKKADGSFGRLIMDVGHIVEHPFNQGKIDFFLREILRQWPVKLYSPRVVLFRDALLSNIKSVKMRKMFEIEFAKFFKNQNN